MVLTEEQKDELDCAIESIWIIEATLQGSCENKRNMESITNHLIKEKMWMEPLKNKLQECQGDTMWS